MELSEVIEKSRVDDVFLCEGPREPQVGSLALIGHHLIFSPITSSPQSKSNNQELWLLHRAVDRVHVEPISRNSTTKQGGCLRLKCKNFMICSIEIKDLDDCMAVARSIEKLSNLNGIEHDYPYYYRTPFMILDDGWEAFNLEQYFSRLLIKCRDRWRISEVNKNFEVCPSYPETVVVPKGIGDDFLKISATFRDGGRFPVLSYYHAETKSCIIRCAQPLIGPTNRRCKEDETIINTLLSSVSKGGGCESQLYYSQWKYVYGNVPRIKDLHDSLAKLIEACNDSNNSSNWIGKLAASGWLQSIADTISGAGVVAQCVHCEGSGEVPIVVHGAEGVDSTLLVTSIAQLCLDSDARTLRGFQSLIEHEWVMAGHPFTLRCAHSAYATGSLTGPHESPVFLCFLDSVWQIMRQYPCSFEFTEEFLIFLFEHAYASEFGTFLGNNEMEKVQFRIKDCTVSLWSYVNHPEILSTFLNPLYEPYDSVLWPSVAPQSIVLWERMYLRWQQNWTEFDAMKHKLIEWKRHEKELQSRLLQMQKAHFAVNNTTKTKSHIATNNSDHSLDDNLNSMKITADEHCQ
ncbi:myotubularin-like phosphatase domain-containing protein [Ditylenchus destructor]|uniref:Myotubularin-like phosphatase domain-containing protein n=1 Tax=Ditylenchus destructor TaxID=166010 RepID=A0AAD4NG19_9BILA|nr:myotubularin-like phosphatase domain-containing protein [Ditylenchus destructor]